MKRTIVATACDAAHFALAEDLLRSLHRLKERAFKIGFIQVGENAAPAALVNMADEARVASNWGAQLKENEGFAVAYLAIKPRLPEFFPGYDTYVWLDSDTWVQNSAGIAHIVDHVHLADICVHPQLDPNYWGCLYPDNYTVRVYDLIFGADVRRQYFRYPMINAGVFGAAAQSPLWERWTNLLGEIRDKLQDQENRFFSDQIPLHRLIYSGALRPYPLRAVDNWLVQHAVPRLDLANGRLTAPSFPYEEINIVHLVGAAKSMEYRLGELRISLRYRDIIEKFGRSAAAR